MHIFYYRCVPYLFYSMPHPSGVFKLQHENKDEIVWVSVFFWPHHFLPLASLFYKQNCDNEIIRTLKLILHSLHSIYSISKSGRTLMIRVPVTVDCDSNRKRQNGNPSCVLFKIQVLSISELFDIQYLKIILYSKIIFNLKTI